MALIDIEEILLGPVSIPNFKTNLSNSFAVVIAFIEVWHHFYEKLKIGINY